jgi:hypothetical protein
MGLPKEGVLIATRQHLIAKYHTAFFLSSDDGNTNYIKIKNTGNIRI